MNLSTPKPLRDPAAGTARRTAASDAYLPALDGLRGLAVLIVMTSHVVTDKIPGGFGVTLFFFISGFIITRNCLAHGFTATAVLPFYVKRFFRLAPAVFAYIVVAAVVIERLGGHLPWEDVRATVFYYANYHRFTNDIGHFRVAPLEMTWSLAVEEHFYLAFPLALLVARTPARLAGLMIGTIVATCLWREWLAARGAPFWTLYAHTDARIDSIAYGCLISATFAVAERQRSAAALLAFARRGAVAAFAAACLAATVWAEAMHPARDTQLHLAQGLALMPIFCFLFAAPRAEGPAAARWLGSGFLVWTGRLSYSLYLFHVIANYATKEIGLHTQVRVATAFALSFLGAWLSYRFVETPGRRLGRQLVGALRHRSAGPPGARGPAGSA